MAREPAEVLATELVRVLRSKRYFFMAQGMHGPTVAAEFKEHADDLHSLLARLDQS